MIQLLKIILPVLLIWTCTSCHTLKTTGHTTRDSVVVKTVDSIVYKTVINTKDSVIIHDSAIGISGNSAGFDIDFNSTTDTVIKKGSLRITRTVNSKGKEHIECTSDSLTLVITNLQTIVRQKDSETDKLKVQLSTTSTSHSEIVIKEQKENWFLRTWNKIKGVFSWIGLIAVISLIVYIIKRYFIR